MADITNADLNALGDRITASFRHEIGLARAENAKDIRGVYHRIDELRAHQEKQNGKVDKNTASIESLRTDQRNQGERISRVEERVDDHTNDIGAIDERTKNVSPDLGVTLTGKQKAIFVGALVTFCGAVLEGASHAIPRIVAFFTQGQ